MKFEAFDTWQQVIDTVEVTGAAWYHAPLDWKPRLVRAYATEQVVTIRPHGFGDSFDSFIADSGHLSRFRRPVIENEDRYDHEEHQRYGHAKLAGCGICDAAAPKPDDEPGDPHDWENCDPD